jgi:phage gp29-like protein
MAILDHLGRPMTVNKKLLAEEVAKPGLTGVRQAWSAETATAGLTPDRLAAIVRQADHGDMDAFLTLAEEMEERDPHYGAVLQTRKLAVIGLDRKLTWSKKDEDDPRADAIMEACEDLISEPAFEELLFHQLDALAKGYAVSEIGWDTSSAWRPARYLERDPRWFRWDRETGRELRLKDPAAPDGLPLAPAKFVVHRAGRKSGLPARGGLARLVAFSFVCKLYGLKDWMSYAEIFGIPLRLGRFDGSASPADVDILKLAVFGLGSDAAAVIPKSMEIEFPDLGQATGGAELFAVLVQFLDNQVSKAVLGQSGTTDMQSGGGYAQATVLDEVRGDLTKADGRALAATVTRDALTPFVRFNHGADAPVPGLELVVDEPEDMEALSTALERLVPLGLRVGQSEIRKKLKLSEPASDDELLIPPAAATPEAAAGPADPAEPEEDEEEPEAPPPDERRALARVGGQADALARRQAIEGELDEIVLQGLDGWERTWGAEAQAVVAAIREAGSFEVALTRLDALARDLSAPGPARSLARAMFLAAATGEEASRGGA